MSEFSLDDLLEKTGGPFPSLYCLCMNNHLLEVGRKLGQWRSVAPWLGFDLAAVEALEHNHYDDEGRRQLMLTMWKQRKGCEATYQALAAALLKTGRTDLAEEVVGYSKVKPATLSSTRSSQHSSCYQTPPGTPSFLYSSPVMGTPSMLRSAEHSADVSPHRTLHFPSRQEGMHIPQAFPPHQAEPQSGIAMQTDDQCLHISKLCMSQGTTSSSYYSATMLQKINSVCGVGSGYGLPPQNAIEMKQLQNKVQQLEAELQITHQRYERLRLEQQQQHNDYERMIRLLKQQLHDTASDANCQVAQLTTQLRQIEARFLNSKGEDSTDSGSDISRSSSSSSSTEGYEEHQCYTVKSFVCALQEEITRTVSSSTCGIRGHGSVCEKHTAFESKDDIFDTLDKFQLRFEQKHADIVEHLKKQRESEVAANSLTFLEANSRMTEVVSQSLECLSGDSAGLGEDFRWLQQHLDTCRIARHASWP